MTVWPFDFERRISLPPGKTEGSTKRKIFLFWIPLLLLFLVGNTTADSWARVLEWLVNSNTALLPASYQAKIAASGQAYFIEKATATFLVPLRAQLFLAALLLLVIPLSGALKRFYRESISAEHLRRALYIFMGLIALAATLKANHMGEQYAFISAEPFAQETGYYYRRILLPALAYFTQLKGFIAYNLLSFFFAYILILVCLVFFEKNDFKTKTVFLLSIFTSGCVIVPFQSPGYVEQGVFILFFISLLVPLTKYGRAALAVLMFSAHDAAALVVLLPAVLFIYPRNERPLYVAIILCYVCTWLLHFGFDLNSAISAQTQLARTSAIELIREYPDRAIAGTFFAYKALWILLLPSLYLLVRGRHLRIAAAILCFLCLPVGMIFLGVDTSRIIGFGTPGLFFTLLALARYVDTRSFNALLVVNLAIPSIAYTLGQGPWLAPGVYSLLYAAIL